MALKVHLSDASTHQPLSGVTVEIFTNHTPVASDTSGADGNAFIRFPYRLGDLLVVTATKRGYVPNSIPWRPDRLPGNLCHLFTIPPLFFVMILSDTLVPKLPKVIHLCMQIEFAVVCSTNS